MIRSRLCGQRDSRRRRLAIPRVLDRDCVAGLLGQRQLLQLNVAPRRLTVDLGDHVLRAQPGRGGGAARGHYLDEEPFGQPRLFSRCGWYRDRLQSEEGVGGAAGGDDLIGDALGEINRYGKTEPDAAALSTPSRR